MPAPYIVAELSANHAQSLSIALQSLETIKATGANAAKLQTYTPDCLTLNSKKPPFVIQGTLWDQETLYQLYQRAAMPLEWHNVLFERAKDLELELFSSVFSIKGLELLEKLNCPMYKIASFEITDLELIAQVASTHKPLIISTGIATHTEILDALQACHKVGNSQITLLHCTSAYPTPLQAANLGRMPLLQERYQTSYGLSDHTLGSLSAIIATALKASMIEKHFILDKSLESVDRSFSMNAQEFTQMVSDIHNTHLALGFDNPLEEIPQEGRQFARSLFITKTLKKGTTITREHVKALRPNAGLAPKLLPQILGKKATKDLEYAHPLTLNDLEG
ncbi:pseudaminic acid synthase [Helicobacter baculiformis]|uniref:Pseudaminic acid synthase n=1 Tax=Helicobacter baculiformis TaxID=427351 RepID=A0ABV7ZMF9_9HELI|nr:pseudaminic acid synthase [Helicobacter baculiformis]